MGICYANILVTMVVLFLLVFIILEFEKRNLR